MGVVWASGENKQRTLTQTGVREQRAALPGRGKASFRSVTQAFLGQGGSKCKPRRSEGKGLFGEKLGYSMGSELGSHGGYGKVGRKSNRILLPTLRARKF